MSTNITVGSIVYFTESFDLFDRPIAKAERTPLKIIRVGNDRTSWAFEVESIHTSNRFFIANPGEIELVPDTVVEIDGKYYPQYMSKEGTFKPYQDETGADVWYYEVKEETKMETIVEQGNYYRVVERDGKHYPEWESALTKGEWLPFKEDGKVVVRDTKEEVYQYLREQAQKKEF